MENNNGNQKKDNTKVKRKSPGTLEMMRRQTKMRRATNISKDLRNVIGFVVLVLIIWFLMSGIVNQVKTGQNIVEWALQMGQRISVFILDLFNGKFLKVTENGIYFK